MTITASTARNATLADLSQLLTDEHARKVDMVIPASQIRSVNGQLVVTGADPVVEADGVTDPNGVYTPTVVCDEHIADKLGIPLAYVRRMRADRPDLFDANVNGWLHGADADGLSIDMHTGLAVDLPGAPADQRSFLLRTFRADDTRRGVARALLSDSYRIVDNLDALVAALDGIRDAGVNISIDGCDLTDRRMYVRVIAPEVQALAPVLLDGYRSPFTGASGTDNPTVFAGFEISNSEVGGGAFSIVPRLVIQVCNNGLKITKDAVRAVHLGARLDDGVIRWSDDTQRKNIDLITAKARDAVVTFLDVDYMTDVIRRLEAKSSTPVTDAAGTIEVIGKQLRFGEDHTRGVLDYFIAGGQLTAGGVAAAVTAYSQTIADADTAAEFEAQALPALDLAAA